MAAMKRSRPPRRHRRPSVEYDLLALGGLFLLLCGLLAYILLLPPSGESFSLDRVPTRATLGGFYGIEENAGGAFRWSKPEATIALPVGAPGRYRVAITLQDSLSAPAARQLTLASGDAAHTFSVDAVLKEYPDC